MKKRIFSLLLVFYILILNCVSVFALDSFVLNNFVNVSFNDTVVLFINNNLENKYIYYLMYRLNGSNNHTIVSSTQKLSFFQNPDNLKEITVSNLSSDTAVLVSNNSKFNKGEILSGVSFTVNPGGDTNYKILPELLIYNKDCVNSNYCSSDIYVEFKEDTGDYEEDGVIIKGLTAFFNKITSSIDGIVDDLISELKELIGLPPEGYFISKFEEIKTNLDNKYNFSSVFEIFNNLKSIQAQKPYFDKTFTFSFADIDIPFHFKIDFDFIDSIRVYLFAFIRAFGYFYLIIYNMNQYYLLFRGQRFFYDMRDSYSYTDSNGKEHSHERGEKKWY